MNSRQIVTITLTFKEAECLIWMADYGINDDMGDNTPWDKEDKKAIRCGSRAVCKIWAAIHAIQPRRSLFYKRGNNG